MKTLLLTVFIVFFCSASAQKKVRVPTFEELEIKEKTCEDTFPPYVSRDCYFELAAQYEIILNDVYKKLLASVKPQEKKILIDAERKWIAYKDADINFRTSVAIAYGNEGYRLMELFKERASYLSRMLEGVENLKVE